MSRDEVDVLIVGGGIAGPAVAAALAPHEMRVALLERSPDPLDTARGDHLQPRAVDLLDGWGALDDILALGAERREGTIWYDAEGELLLRSIVTDLDLAHPYFLYLNHELINQALLTAAARNPNFALHRPVAGWELVERSSTSCTVEVDSGDGTTTVTAAVLVGADGQSSRVRHAAGIRADLYRYRRPVSVFFAPYVEPVEGNCLTAHIGDRGIVALVPRTGGVCKIGIASAPDELKTWRELDPAAIDARIKAMADGLPFAEPELVGVYPPVRVVADRWVSDNIVLVGDACHAMHPAQSQGMNVSIRCAAALADALASTTGHLAHGLNHFAATTRPAIEPVLEANHQAGSLFDTTDVDQIRAFVDVLRGMGRSEQATLGYSLASAGYPPPASPDAGRS